MRTSAKSSPLYQQIIEKLYRTLTGFLFQYLLLSPHPCLVGAVSQETSSVVWIRSSVYSVLFAWPLVRFFITGFEQLDCNVSWRIFFFMILVLRVCPYSWICRFIEQCPHSSHILLSDRTPSYTCLMVPWCFVLFFFFFLSLSSGM